MALKKGSKVYFKVGTHKGYRKGVIEYKSKLTINKNDRRINYRIKPTDSGSKPSLKYNVTGSKVRRRK